MRLLLLSALAVFVSAASAAHADTIKNFNLHSDFNGGYVAQGTVTIDVTSGIVETSHIVLSQGSTVDATFTTPDSYDETFGSSSFIAEFPDPAQGYTYDLILPTASLVGYTGGSVCTQSATCSGYPSGIQFSSGGGEAAIDGSLSPTPEPSSLLLLATGLLAGLVVLRQRSASRQGTAAARNTAGVV